MAPSPGWPQPDVAASCRSGRIRVMKAASCCVHGPPEVLLARDVPRPSPKQREILVKVHATSVTVSDTYGRDGFGFARWWQRFLVRLAFGYRRPRNPILGIVQAGEVEQVGKGVTRFRSGDRVPADCRAARAAHRVGGGGRAFESRYLQNGSAAGTNVTGTSFTNVPSHRANSSIPSCSDGMCPRMINAFFCPAVMASATYSTVSHSWASPITNTSPSWRSACRCRAKPAAPGTTTIFVTRRFGSPTTRIVGAGRRSRIALASSASVVSGRLYKNSLSALRY